VRALIVDDEPLARRGVALRLRKFRNIEVVGECGDGSTAVEQILQLAPDIVFLDVEMPEINGFDVLRALPRENLPAIIFLTAYEQHAVRAFEVHALDYLLKPVDDVRFAAAIERAQKVVDTALKTTMAERVLGMLDQTSETWASRFMVQTGSRIQVVLAQDVEWIGAMGDYVELHAGGRSYLLRQTMTSMERRLDPSRFLRIHRSRIVQTGSILELFSIENREYIVRLSDNSQHRSSRTYAVNLERWLSSDRP
jgi:two-component system, LytTR family, response regulator